jgi:hypothetical protein
LIVLFAVIMSFMLDGRNVSVVRDHSSSHSLVAMSFVSLNRSQDSYHCPDISGCFWNFQFQPLLSTTKH